MQHPIYLETHSLQGNLNTNILILYTRACSVEEGEFTVQAGCKSSCVKHIPQTSRFVLIFWLPSLMNLVSVYGEDWVCLSKEVLLYGHGLDNE